MGLGISDEKLTPVSASVVNEEHVAIVQESGEKDWWTYDRPFPENLKIYPSIKGCNRSKATSCPCVTHRNLTEKENVILENGVLYRPKVLSLELAVIGVHLLKKLKQ